jgi:molybdopterin molybdotransferase
MVAHICDREHKGRDLLAYAAALDLLERDLKSLDRAPESVPLLQAAGRVLAAPVCLDRDEPPVARSAMDGFAVRSADALMPRRVVGSVFAGSAELPQVGPGEAAEIMTGGSLPPGADAVVPVELTRVEAGALLVQDPPLARQHLRQAGEMGQRGRVVLEAGRCLRPGDLGIAAAVGAEPLRVTARARVTVISTGDEVLPWTAAPATHQVRDSNRLSAVLRLAELGAEIIHHSHLPDNAEQLSAGLRQALNESDLVVTIGGVSMGKKDLLPGLLDQLGVQEIVHGVAIQPGKPVWIGRRDATWVLGLPGNPVSSFVILELFGRPILQRLSGSSAPLPLDALLPGILHQGLRSRARALWLPARLRLQRGAAPQLEPADWKGSGDWTALGGADALIFVPPETVLAAGAAIHYLSLR